MTIKQALKIAEKVTGINPRNIRQNPTKGGRKMAVKLTVLFMVEEFSPSVAALALGTSEGNIYYHFNHATDLLTRSRELKRMYWRLRAAVEEFETADELKAAA